MTMEIKSREQIVSDEIAVIQAALPSTFQIEVGSIIRAIVDAHGATALWEESLIQFVLARTRLATSEGKDADTFVEDYGLTRLPGVAATGNVTFSSIATNQIRYIDVGAEVTTEQGAPIFAVIADPTNPNYNAATQQYSLPIGTASLSIPVQATTVGENGNVNANTITVIRSQITGIDNVNNPIAFDTGKNTQTDAALRKYFVDYINSLSRATRDAIAFAIESVQDNLIFNLVENKNYTTGAEQLGFFYAVVDDGSGNPSDDLIESVRKAIEAYRGFTIRPAVYKPQQIVVNIVADIIIPQGELNPNYNPALINDVVSALQLYLLMIPFGDTLFYTRICQIIYNVIQSDIPVLLDDTNVTGILVNNNENDIPSNGKQKFVPGTITVLVKAD